MGSRVRVSVCRKGALFFAAGRAWKWPAIVALAVAGIACLSMGRHYLARVHQTATTELSSRAAGKPSPVAVRAPLGDGLDAGTAARIKSLLESDKGFEHDAVFLVAASVRERCNPEHAGELAKMASRAGLPVLAATSKVTGLAPELDRAIYVFVQRLADSVPCGRALDLRAAGLASALDPEAYAAAFPDSYYTPALKSVPAEFMGLTLAQRSRQGCQSIAYAVLPLQEPDWRCAGSRSSARRRIVRVCGEGRMDGAAGMDQGEVSALLARSITGKVAEIVGRLPQACR